MKVLKLIVLGIVASRLAGLGRAAAQGLIGAPVSPNGNGGGTRTELPSYQKEINRRLCAALITYPGMARKAALVYVPTNKDGAITSELIFTQMTGSLEADFACYDAIMSSAPFYSLSLPRSSNDGYSFYSAYSIPFGMTTENKIFHSETRIVSSYFKTHPKQAGKVLLVRSIPPSVLYSIPASSLTRN